MPITTDLETEIGQVRAELGDETEGAGVLPDGANVSDALIQLKLTAEGSVMRAVAAVAEMIRNRYAKLVDAEADGVSRKLSQLWQHWQTMAAHYRGLYGYGSSGVLSASAFSVEPDRVDGYSEYADDGEYGRG